MAPSAHESFKALGPTHWDKDLNPNDDESLKDFLTKTFSDAQCLVDSVPVTIDPTTRTVGRPRSSTDPTRPKLPSRAPQSSERARELRKEWKEVKVNPRENPLGLNVYKLSSKDGKGSWFARRSVHEGLSFEKWKLGMEREFAESMKVQGKPGSGNIRGIGAEKRVECKAVEGCGKIEVYQLSAQFPGPTTPREFVTLLLTSDCALETPMQEGRGNPRYFMVVSKPCLHNECPQRSGFIRGNYESVEFIREIKIEKPLRKTHSSIDLSTDESAAARKMANDMSKEAMVRSARQTAIHQTDDGTEKGEALEDDEYDTVIEWLMVTRSDPGGSVPRFMVEKGTPGGIAGDADKFLKWVTSKSLRDFDESDNVDAEIKEDAVKAEESAQTGENPRAFESTPSTNIVNDPFSRPTPIAEEYEPPTPMGFYGMIAGALGAAASRLPAYNPWAGSTQGDSSPELSPDSGQEDDASSIRSFHSFESDQEEETQQQDGEQITPSVTNGEEQSTHSSTESQTTRSNALSQHEKELRKLEDRKRKMEEKLNRAQQRALAKKGDESTRDESVMAKLREKHEREIAKQEEKYQRDLRKIEAKRVSDQRKAEERRRKQAEREERNNLTIELEKVRAERDIARKQSEVLMDQVGDLQAQNTMLVARLGREGITLDGGVNDIFSDLKKNNKSTSKLTRSVTALGTSSGTSSAANSVRREERDKDRDKDKDKRQSLRVEGFSASSVGV